MQIQPEPQQIISAAIELRDRLAETPVALRVPFPDAPVGDLSEYISGFESDLHANSEADALVEQRMRVASDLARLLDPAVEAGDLIEEAGRRRDAISGRIVSFSPKVFIDLTRLCRDRCTYCTFVRNPLSAVARSRGYEIRYSPDTRLSGAKKDRTTIPLGPGASREAAPYLLPEEVLSIAEAGREAGCREALFTLGDRPEDRYPVARRFLTKMGYDSTPHYLIDCARLVLEETGLLPHLNPGVMTAEELRAYKEVSASCGMMLETTSWRLYADPSGCHYNCPDKAPPVRVATIEAAGENGVPFTTGLLVGIGEGLEARADTLIVLSALAIRWGHIQEIIVQNFRAKSTTPMAEHPEPSFEEMMRVVALARLLAPSGVAVQAPPNLSPGIYGSLLGAGLSDWGGISPVTLDHVNPEASWPQIAELRQVTESEGFELRARLCVYPSFATSEHWVSESVRPYLLRASDENGWAIPSGELGRLLRHPSDEVVSSKGQEGVLGMRR